MFTPTEEHDAVQIGEQQDVRLSKLISVRSALGCDLEGGGGEGGVGMRAIHRKQR